MSFFRFVFSFLYTRNWHTGQMETSTPRVILFSVFLFLLGIATIMIFILQAPIEYYAK